MVDVSIIIVNYKTVSLIKHAISSILHIVKDIEYEIIIVDNCSGDYLEEIKKEFPLKLILLSENLGFGKANNEAAKKAKGRNLFFLNPDTYLINNAVKLLSDYLDAHENIGIVGGNLYTAHIPYKSL